MEVQEQMKDRGGGDPVSQALCCPNILPERDEKGTLCTARLDRGGGGGGGVMKTMRKRDWPERI